jgi:microcystin-dependent protein
MSIGQSSVESTPTVVEVPIGGCIIWFAEVLPGPNWGWADGGELLKSDYSYLFAIWGFKHGTPTGGTGGTLFKKPDLRDRFPRGASSTVPVGTTSVGGGALSGSASLGVSDLPPHTHPVGTLSISPNPHSHDYQYATNANVGGTGLTIKDPAGTTTGAISATALSITGATGSTGSGTSFAVSISGSVDPPSVSVNYAIRLR